MTSTEDTFRGSRVRHGTYSGYTKHVNMNERPCDACYRAKQSYDKARLETPERLARKRLAARAQGDVHKVLRARHNAEYRELYQARVRELRDELDELQDDS